MRQIALITGASSGIGLQLAQHLLKNKTNIQVIAVGRQLAPLQDLKDTFKERLSIIQADISTEAGRDSLLKVIADVSLVNFVIHCAAIVTPLKPLAEISYEQWQLTQQTNLDAPLFLTLKLLDKFSQSRVMFITSDVELQAVVGAGSYCISKMALHMAWACLKAEIPAHKATFSLVAPGNVDTPMQAQIRQTDPTHLPMAPMLNEYYLQGKLLDPKYVAQFLTWLLLDVKSNDYVGKIWNIYTEIASNRWPPKANESSESSVN